MRNRIMAILLAVLVLAAITMPAAADERGGRDTNAVLEAAIERTAEFLCKTIPLPEVLSGDWAVYSVAISGYTAPQSFYDAYYTSVTSYLRENDGVLHSRKYTEYSRVILALTAAGYDARDVAGYDLTAPLAEFDTVLIQGINGPAWALMALDSAPEYRENAELDAACARYIDEILSRQRSDGRFTLSGGGDAPTSEPNEADVTAMVITALAPYRERAEVAEAIERAIAFLKTIQQENGGFISRGELNCESAAQVVLAINACGVTDFQRNGFSPLDAMMTFAREDGAFEHVRDYGIDLIATQQALCALVSERERLIDAPPRVLVINPATEIVFPGRKFDDMDGRDRAREVHLLAERGVINGVTETQFDPEGAVTRAQYAALIVRALGLDFDNVPSGVSFVDVPQDAWYADSVKIAYYSGIINGRSAMIFDPEGTIIRSESILMLERAAALVDANVSIDGEPTDVVSREELAVGLCAMMESAGLIDEGNN